MIKSIITALRLIGFLLVALVLSLPYFCMLLADRIKESSKKGKSNV